MGALVATALATGFLFKTVDTAAPVVVDAAKNNTPSTFRDSQLARNLATAA
jgi:hypothetical protein